METSSDRTEKISTLRFGILMLVMEVIVIVLIAVINFSLFTKMISMILANHVGGRLAFIAVGLENNLSIYFIILFIILYNTTYILLTYSIFVLCAKRLKEMAFFKRSIESVKQKAMKRKRTFKKWNSAILFLFVWLPLPWTGAAIGSYIAHLEGYSTKNTLLIVFPAMWAGVISWTIWFDELYQFIDKFGKAKTIYITLALIGIPLLAFLFDFLWNRGRQAQTD